jgi:hypothetical protein
MEGRMWKEVWREGGGAEDGSGAEERREWTRKWHEASLVISMT